MFHGSIPALITPFKDGGVDEKALRDLVNWHVAEGSHGLVPVGTTGESPTLTHEEHERVVKIVVEEAAGRLKVIAGAGSNNTVEAVRFAQYAESVGADGILVVTPYYNKPSQRGIVAHFEAIHAACDLPILLYNIPSRSVVDISVETMGALAKLPRVVGVKDATGDVSRISDQRIACGEEFIQLSGNDEIALAVNAQGGHGCITTVGNIAPRLSAEMQNACAEGDYRAARAIHDRLFPLFRAAFMEPNPVPTKYALSLLGRCSDEVRLPLVGATDATKAKVRDAMVHAGLLNG